MEMPLLNRFNPPANLDEGSAATLAGWNARVSKLMKKAGGADLFQFFNPLETEGDPANLTEHAVTWTAFPATLIRTGGSDSERWRAADTSRDAQDEYCEWAVKRSGDEIERVTFTTETPDYFEQLLESDEELLLDLYEELTGRRPEVGNIAQDGRLDPKNNFNRDGDGGIAHLSQASNNLFAAIALVAQATVLRERDGEPVTDQSALIECGQLGEPRRSSDPQIAGAVNQLAAEGNELSLADPAGLYIDEFISAGLTTPDGTDAGEFWKVTRGSESQALRATFEVPADKGYSVSEIEVAGKPITTGAQLADKVRVRVTALSRPGDHQPVRQPCVA
jgi:hypothetical protein